MKKIPINQILPNPEQPRRTFDEEGLAGLAESIRENGLLQPIIVEQAADDQYILRDGERRWRACQLADLDEIAAVIIPPPNGSASRDRLVQALVANLQREDLNPIDEARAYKRMIEDLGISQAAIARIVGFRELRIASRLKLLELDEPIQEMVSSGKLPRDKRVVDAFMSIPDRKARTTLASRLTMNNNPSISLIESSCKRLRTQLEKQETQFTDPPAITFARHRASAPRNTQIWNQLHELGRLPSWELVTGSAEKTCRNCALFEVASANTCGECPAISLVVNLVEAAMEKNKP